MKVPTGTENGEPEDLYFENEFWTMKLEDFADITEFPMTTELIFYDLGRLKENIKWKYQRNKATERALQRFNTETAFTGDVLSVVKKNVATTRRNTHFEVSKNILNNEKKNFLDTTKTTTNIKGSLLNRPNLDNKTQETRTKAFINDTSGTIKEILLSIGHSSPKLNYYSTKIHRNIPASKLSSTLIKELKGFKRVSTPSLLKTSGRAGISVDKLTMFKKHIATEFSPKTNVKEWSNLDLNDKIILDEFSHISCKASEASLATKNIEEITSRTQTPVSVKEQQAHNTKSTKIPTKNVTNKNRRQKQNVKPIKETKGTTKTVRFTKTTLTTPLNKKTSRKEYHNRRTTATKEEHKNKKIATTKRAVKATMEPLKQKAEKEHECDLMDFNQRTEGCICSVNILINDLRKEIRNKDFYNTLDTYTCPGFTKIGDAIIISKETQPLIRKRRSFYFFNRSKREFIENSNIQKVLDAEPRIINTDSLIYGKMGEKLSIPCMPLSDSVEEYDNPSYLWSFNGGNLPKASKKSILEIDKISAEDAGKYTCTLTYSNVDVNETKKFEHELSIISLPIYSVRNSILYNMSKKCDLKDTDEVAVYLPKILNKYICGGNDLKMCNAEIPHPQCVNKGDRKHLFLALTYTMQPLDLILPSINTTICDNNCQMKTYSKITSILGQNLEVVQKLPVISRIHKNDLTFTPTPASKKRNSSEFFTKEPQLSITCPGGFGLHQKQLRVCTICAKNTYNNGDDSCKNCPVGQYQPNVGSKACLTCTSPLQDPACLRIMYTNTKTFRVYVGCAFGVLISLIILIACCGSKKDAKHKKRNAHEMEDMRPLIKTSRKKRKRGKSPPVPPPPDF